MRALAVIVDLSLLSCVTVLPARAMQADTSALQCTVRHLPDTNGAFTGGAEASKSRKIGRHDLRTDFPSNRAIDQEDGRDTQQEHGPPAVFTTDASLTGIGQSEGLRQGEYRASRFAMASYVLPLRSRTRDSRFHWGGALRESFEMLAAQHILLLYVGGDKRYIDATGGIPFNHYWRDYKLSLHNWLNSGWDDGDPFLDNYIGHPIQGALTGYIQVNNDPSGRTLEFENSRRYWKSRLKAMMWAGAYSTQWEIGPLSEMTVEKYGIWRAWTQNGKKVNGEGQVDLVVTPVGGLGWMVMEDYIDHKALKTVERHTSNRFVIDMLRCGLNPIHSVAMLLHNQRPWYRPSRDGREPQ